MAIIAALQSSYIRLRERAYEILEVAAPGDVLSYISSLGIISLVVINVAAFGLGHLELAGRYERHFYYIELCSVALFSAEYLLRLWSCTSASLYKHPITGRLRFALRAPMLIDLAAVLPFYLPLFVTLDLRVLRLLRLFRLARLFKLARFLREPPADETVITDLLNEFQRTLARIRGELGQGRERDLSALRDKIDEAVTQVRRSQRALFVHRRRRASVELDREELLAPLDQLETFIGTEEWHTAIRPLISSAYSQSAALFGDAPEWASMSISIGWKNIQGFNRVPVRRIGSYHFRRLAARDESAYRRFCQAYIGETRLRLAALRSSLNFALDQIEQNRLADLPKEVRINFNRSVNRLRDLGEPARSAWEGLLWELEDDQQRRMDLIRIDIGRYGSMLFYVGRCGRWLRRRLRSVVGFAVALLGRIVPDLRQWAKTTYTVVRDRSRPTLQWLGLVKTQTQEVLQTVDQVQLMQQRDLAQDYLQHFSLDPLQDEALFVGFDEELELLDQAIQRWEDGLTSSFLLYGQRGAGKTTLLNIAEARLFDEDQPVTRATVERKITSADNLVGYLSQVLGFSDIDGFEVLAQELLAGPRRAVLLEGCHNLYLRRIGGLEAVRHILWLVARTNHHILWGLCMDEHARRYISKSQPIDQLFHYEIGIQRWEPHELRQLVLLRHNQSGYGLTHALDISAEKIVRRRVKGWRRPEEPAVQEALSQLFFERLTAVSGDNILVALHYWLYALEPAAQDRYRVRPMRALDLDLVNEASPEQAFILTAILQHDNLTAQETADILDTNLIQTRLELEILDNLNVLDFDPDNLRYRVNPIVLGPVRDMLEGRNLLY